CNQDGDFSAKLSADKLHRRWVSAGCPEDDALMAAGAPLWVNSRPARPLSATRSNSASIGSPGDSGDMFGHAFATRTSAHRMIGDWRYLEARVASITAEIEALAAVS